MKQTVNSSEILHAHSFFFKSHSKMPAFQKNKVTNFAKQRITEAFLNLNEDFLKVAKVLKVNRVTGYTIVSRRDVNERSLADYRYDLVSEILEQSKIVVTVEKCRAWERNVIYYLPSCLAFNDIQG